MNRRRLLVYLTCVLFAMQVAVIVFAQIMSADHTPASLVVSVLIALIIGATDMAVTRYLLSALKHAESAYAQDVSRKLEESFELYRLEAAREEELVQEIGRAVNNELSQAREALAQQRLGKVDDHLRTSVDIASQTHSSYCDNITVSAVLESKARQCSRAGIKLRARVSLPRELTLPDVDVAALFFNLIDNAMHECEALMRHGELHSEPLIDVRSQTRAGQLFLEVENPSREGGNTRRVTATRKARGRSRHGWGTQVVSSIAEQYGGVVDFAEGDGIFTASVLIPLPEEAILAQAE